MNGLAWLAVGFSGTVLASITGCAPSSTYFTADRATYDAIAPEYSTYVTADPTLSPEQRDRRQRTLAAWKMRLDAQSQTPAPSVTPSP